MKRALAILLLALTPAVAHGQGLYHLGFTLDGEPGPGWQMTPLGVVSDYRMLEWQLTLRGLLRAEDSPADWEARDAYVDSAPATEAWITTLVEP